MNMSEPTLASLVEQRKKLDSDIKKIKSAQRNGVIAQIKSLMSEYEITVKDIDGKAGRTATAKVVPIKFQDTEGHTWTGRGKMPRWLVGKDKEQFRVPQ
jgi:DNA-binding protein H-NS